eukprot:9604812-Lingulodinium_polyedra.AAC.1
MLFGAVGCLMSLLRCRLLVVGALFDGCLIDAWLLFGMALACCQNAVRMAHACCATCSNVVRAAGWLLGCRLVV